jgi:hypothetical protein
MSLNWPSHNSRISARDHRALARAQAAAARVQAIPLILAAQGGAGQAAAVFFRGPGEVNVPNGPQFIDYNLEANKKANKYPVTGLTEKFDLSPNKLQSFLNRVTERVAEQNWYNIINITFPVPPAVAGQAALVAPPPINLITSYGQVTGEQVQTHAAAFMVL